jgi:transposase
MTVANHSTTIGIDLGDKRSHIFVLDNDSREGVETSQLQTKAVAFQRYFACKGPTRMVMEVGTHSGWVSRLLSRMEHEVLVADPRKVRSLAGDGDKDDGLDAEFLARIGRADPKLLKPIQHRTEDTQVALAIIRTRDALVRGRTRLVNHLRGVVKSLGERLPSCAAERFHTLAPQLPEVVREALEPTMQCIAEMTKTIRRCERQISQKIKREYPEASLLQEINGVGPITALTFVLIIEDPSRFDKSRKVGSYLGLCRRRFQSGKSDPELHISKRGDRLLRRLLVNCAQYILGPFAPDSDLRRWGLAYAATGSKTAKRRAVVAVARKLAVLMHRLWTVGEVYDPLHNSRQRQDAQQCQC